MMQRTSFPRHFREGLGVGASEASSSGRRPPRLSLVQGGEKRPSNVGFPVPRSNPCARPDIPGPPSPDHFESRVLETQPPRVPNFLNFGSAGTARLGSPA
jgi:hypothetical protein